MTEFTVWRISTFSGQNGSCVAVADLGDQVAIRNSNAPGRGTLVLSPASMASLIAAAKAGEWDDLG